MIVALITTFQVYSQCDKCELEGEFDFCYSNEKFPNHCAAFKDQSGVAVFTLGKKSKDLNFDLVKRDSSLLRLAGNKKLKISAVNILFLEKALEDWAREEKKIGYKLTESGLGIKVLKEGDGSLPEEGKTVKVHYTGWLEDGTKFDSSLDRGQPFTFPLGKGRVIKGWDEGVSKMKVGTKAYLKIPPKLGYGSRGAGRSIPPNSTLIFEIEVLE